MIEVKNLTKKYGPNLAVDNLSFTVEPGQIYGFLGPNGAGKSTTMNIMTGCLAATEGQVLINGHDIFEQPKLAKKQIGYLPEIPPVYTDMTPKEYLAFIGSVKGLSGRGLRESISDVMEQTRITQMQDRLIRNLSKGYRQRVGLSQALLGYPDVIILDEPMVGLDPKQITEIRDLIKKLGKKHTVILSSHILSQVSEVCDVVMIISRGRLTAIDTPANLSKRLMGKNRVVLSVRAGADAAQAATESIIGVENVQVNTSCEEGVIEVVLESAEAGDIREAVFAAFAHAGLAVLSMSSSSASLEDVFLQLTRESGRSADTFDVQSVQEKEDEAATDSEKGGQKL